MAFGQNIEVLENKIIIQKESNRVYSFPKFSPDGEKVLFTSAGYNGLWLFDVNTKAINQLNNTIGAGYEPVFSNDGKEVIFRHEKLLKRRRYFSIASQKINSLKSIDLIKDEREISTPKIMSDKVFVYKKDGNQVAIEYKDNNAVCLLAKPTIEDVNAFCENSTLYLEKDGKRTALTPAGEGHYIWGSISPNKDKILFTLAGKGTYVCDLAGNIELKLQNANSPKWSPDGNWIVFMDDKDDGHIIISSEIKATHLKSQKTFSLTSSNDKIEMYPSWSPKGDAIIYHTLSGNIELLKIKIQE